jgi:SAM-dependent methyltransferase
LVSIDLEDRSGDVDVLADVQAMPQIESDSFDTVLCTQVLEHVPRPWDAMGELRRVLAPGGILVLSVPHLSVIHEAPHDFYRYTRFGIEALCEQAGLEIVELVPTGGILTFLGHGASGFIMSTLGTVPLLRWPTWMLNYLLLVVALGWLDRLVGLPGLYPCDHVAVVQKTAC